jgi:hypothetical protein
MHWLAWLGRELLRFGYSFMCHYHSTQARKRANGQGASKAQTAHHMKRLLHYGAKRRAVDTVVPPPPCDPRS